MKLETHCVRDIIRSITDVNTKKIAHYAGWHDKSGGTGQRVYSNRSHWRYTKRTFRRPGDTKKYRCYEATQIVAYWSTIYAQYTDDRRDGHARDRYASAL